MSTLFEGSRPELPSGEQVNEFAEHALRLIHNLTPDVSGGHVGGSDYQLDDDTFVGINTQEFRNTTPGRPDMVVTCIEFDPDEDSRYTQTEITLWESVATSLQKRTPIPYEVIECEVVVAEEEHQVAVRGLSLQNRVRRMKKIMKAERKIIEKLADPTFTLADYLKFQNLLVQCNETNRIDAE